MFRTEFLLHVNIAPLTIACTVWFALASLPLSVRSHTKSFSWQEDNRIYSVFNHFINAALTCEPKLLVIFSLILKAHFHTPRKKKTRFTLVGCLVIWKCCALSLLMVSVSSLKIKSIVLLRLIPKPIIHIWPIPYYRFQWQVDFYTVGLSQIQQKRQNLKFVTVAWDIKLVKFSATATFSVSLALRMAEACILNSKAQIL